MCLLIYGNFIVVTFGCEHFDEVIGRIVFDGALVVNSFLIG